MKNNQKEKLPDENWEEYIKRNANNVIKTNIIAFFTAIATLTIAVAILAPDHISMVFFFAIPLYAIWSIAIHRLRCFQKTELPLGLKYIQNTENQKGE